MIITNTFSKSKRKSDFSIANFSTQMFLWTAIRLAFSFCQFSVLPSYTHKRIDAPRLFPVGTFDKEFENCAFDEFSLFTLLCTVQQKRFSFLLAFTVQQHLSTTLGFTVKWVAVNHLIDLCQWSILTGKQQMHQISCTLSRWNLQFGKGGIFLMVCHQQLCLSLFF